MLSKTKYLILYFGFLSLLVFISCSHSLANTDAINTDGVNTQSVAANPKAPIQGQVNSVTLYNGIDAGDGMPWLFKGDKAFAAFVHRWMQETHADYLKLQASLDPSCVVLVDRYADPLDTTLNAFGIGHVVISVEKYKGGKCHSVKSMVKNWKMIPWERAKVIIIGCGGVKLADLANNAVPEDERDNIRNFVQSGGLLITTGWTAREVSSSFPGILEITKKYKCPTQCFLFNPIVRVPYVQAWDIKAAGNDAQLFAGVPVELRNTISKRNIFCGTPLIILPLKPENTRILATSTLLTEQDPEHLGIVAALFAYGKGHILHFTCHLEDEGSLDPACLREFIIKDHRHTMNLPQAIAINAIISAVMSPHVPNE